jgi:hypothetical protein
VASTNRRTGGGRGGRSIEPAGECDHHHADPEVHGCAEAERRGDALAADETKTAVHRAGDGTEGVGRVEQTGSLPDPARAAAGGRHHERRARPHDGGGHQEHDEGEHDAQHGQVRHRVRGDPCERGVEVGRERHRRRGEHGEDPDDRLARAVPGDGAAGPVGQAARQAGPEGQAPHEHGERDGGSLHGHAEHE